MNFKICFVIRQFKCNTFRSSHIRVAIFIFKTSTYNYVLTTSWWLSGPKWYFCSLVFFYISTLCFPTKYLIIKSGKVAQLVLFCRKNYIKYNIFYNYISFEQYLYSVVYKNNSSVVEIRIYRQTEFNLSI